MGAIFWWASNFMPKYMVILRKFPKITVGLVIYQPWRVHISQRFREVQKITDCQTVGKDVLNLGSVVTSGFTFDTLLAQGFLIPKKTQRMKLPKAFWGFWNRFFGFSKSCTDVGNSLKPSDFYYLSTRGFLFGWVGVISTVGVATSALGRSGQSFDGFQNDCKKMLLKKIQHFWCWIFRCEDDVPF